MQQQRQLIEASLVPYICKCTVTPGGVVSIRVRDPKTEAVLLDLTGISGSQLMSWNAISALVAGLHSDLEKLKEGGPFNPPEAGLDETDKPI